MSDGLPDRLRSVALDRVGRVGLSLRKATVQHDEDEVTFHFCVSGHFVICVLNISDFFRHFFGFTESI